MLKIRMTRPWDARTIECENAVFSTDFSLAEADCLLCDWEPKRELLTFDGPKAWYCCEPAANPRMGHLGHRRWQRIIKQLQPHEILFHSHQDPAFRVPHITHWWALQPWEAESRSGTAMVVSNFGGRPGRRWTEVAERNRFATSPRVDLYGQRNKWKRYRATGTSWPGLPGNYAGEIPGAWGGDEKLAVLSRYEAVVCLENSQEPYYFTEKFVDAARAGCIPVYRAHATVRNTFLKGAAWIDPADFGGDVDATLDALATMDQRTVAKTNAAWLKSQEVRQTYGEVVFARIADILAGKS